MQLKNNALSLLFICSLFSLPNAVLSSTLSKKDIAIKAAKIVGYTAGTIVPLKVLVYQYSTYDYDESKYKPYETTFIRWLTTDPIKATYKLYIRSHDDESGSFYTQDFDKDLCHASFNELLERASLLGFIGYSAYGLYSELKPILTAVSSSLNHKIKRSHAIK